MSTHRRAREDDGSALLMALVFVMVMGLVITALLTQTTTSLKTTQVVRAKADKVYAADAGLEQAVEALRLDRTLCANPGNSSTLPPVQLNDHTVELSCSNEGAGSSSGANGFAAIVTGTSSSSFTTQGGGSRRIDGPVFAANLGSPNLAVTDGSVFEKQSGSSCSTDANKPGGVTISPSPPFRYRCTVTPVPDPAHALPSSQPNPINLPFTTVGSGLTACRVFTPATYRPTFSSPTPIVLSHNNYFQSGTYYLEDVDLVINTEVIGGKQAPTENSLVVRSPSCQTAQTNDPRPGTGVKWILGGSSRIIVGNNGHLELFARQGGAASEGQMGISVQAPSGGAFAFSTVSFPESLIEVGSAANPELVIHGLVYAPESYLDAFPTNASQANFQGGIVVERLNLRSSSSGAPIVATSNAPGTRDLVVTAIARGQDGSVDVTATAVVSIDNNEARTFKVSSWRIE